MRRDGLVTRRPSKRLGAWSPDTGALQGNLVLWLDNTLITESGGLVPGWPDLSRAGNHASQGSPAIQPVYEAAGWNGSQPSVAFSAASNHVLEANGAAAGFSGDDTPWTINWCVQRTGTETGERYILGPGNAASSAHAVRIGQTIVGTNVRLVSCRDAVSTEVLLTGGDNIVATREQWTAHFDGTTRRFYVNGALVDSDATALGSATFDRFYIGKWRTTSGYDMRTPGGQIYNRALTAQELALLWQWNREHFGGLP